MESEFLGGTLIFHPSVSALFINLLASDWLIPSSVAIAKAAVVLAIFNGFAPFPVSRFK